MMRATRLLLIASLAVFLVACDQDDHEPAAQPLEYEIVTASVHLQIDDPQTRVFRSWNEWSAFWAEHPECNSGCVYAPPYVDFDSSSVAGVFWGLESWIGWDLSQRVEAVERAAERTIVRLREQPPGVALPAEGYAYIILKFERAEGPVEFTGVVPQ